MKITLKIDAIESMGGSRIARRVSWWIAVTLACADALRLAPAPAASQRVRRSAPPSRRALLAGAAAAATLAQLPRAAVAESKKSADGLEWTDVKVGDDVGKVAAVGDTVTIDYVAWLGGFDGREFSRFEKPIKVTLGEGKIVKGLEAALSDGMRPGGVRRVAIPASLAFGSTGFPRSGDKAGTIVPPGATLYFEVRLRTIVLSKGIGFGLNFS